MTKIHRRAGFNLIELLVVLSVLAVVGGVVVGGCGCRGLTSSDGYRDGTIQKFTKKGIVFSTFEGELATEGYKRTEGGGSVWSFSVWDDSVAADLKAVPADSPVRLHYRQHRFVPQWTAGTGYEVYKVESVSGKASSDVIPGG